MRTVPFPVSAAELRHLTHVVEAEHDDPEVAVARWVTDVTILRRLGKGQPLSTRQLDRVLELLLEDDEEQNHYGLFEDYIIEADGLKDRLLDLRGGRRGADPGTRRRVR